MKLTTVLNIFICEWYLEVGRGGELGFSVKHQYFLHKSQNEMIVECIVQYVGTGKIL